jgi:transcription elongation factor GreA
MTYTLPRPGEPTTSKQEHPVSETTSNVIWLTQEAHDRLKEELDFLSGEGRTEMARRIGQAREEGDLRENGGYHAAKEEQGKREARIRQLQQLLESAQVGEPPAAEAGVVAPGMIVTAKVAGEQMRFLVGSREVAGDGIEVYSEKSPLGEAILGRRKGESASYQAPNGKSIAVEIVDTEPFNG